MKAVGQLLIILSLSGWLMGCSTVEGIGKDLKKGGEAIEKAARQ